MVGALVAGAALGQGIQQSAGPGAGLIVELGVQLPDPGSLPPQEQFPGRGGGFGVVGFLSVRGQVGEDAGTERSDLLVPGILGESQQVGFGTVAVLGRNLSENTGDHIDHRSAQAPGQSSRTGRGRQRRNGTAVEIATGVHQTGTLHDAFGSRLGDIGEVLQKPGGGAIPEQLHHPTLLDFHQQRTKFSLGRPHTRDQLTDAVGKSHRLGGESRVIGHASKLPIIEHEFITRSGKDQRWCTRYRRCVTPCPATTSTCSSSAFPVSRSSK